MHGPASKKRVALVRLCPCLATLPLLLGGVGNAGLPAAQCPGEETPLLPGTTQELPIAALERHSFRVEVGVEPVLVLFEQQGINLEVERRGPDGTAVTDASNLRWGPEVLLLDHPGAYRLEARLRDPTVAPARYRVSAEIMVSESTSFRDALAAMGRAAQASAERTPEGRSRARQSWEEALAAWRSLRNRRWQAECLDALGNLAAEERDLERAMDSYSLALSLWRELEERRREAATLNELALNQLYAGEKALAREGLTLSRALWLELGEPLDAAQAASNRCFLDHVGGVLPTALACYQQQLEIFEQLGDRNQRARLLNLIGGVYDLMGEPDAALDHYARVLQAMRAAGDRRGEAQALNNLAVVHRALGEWQQALSFYAQAREVLSILGDRLQQGVLFANLGALYSELGQPDRALSTLEDSLRLRRTVGDRRGEMITLNHLGTARRRLGEIEPALAYHRQALKLAEELGDARQQALTQLLLAQARFEQGDATHTLEELALALEPLRAMGLGRAEAQALALQGRALALAGRNHEARTELAVAVKRCRELRDRLCELETLQALAAAERTLGLSEASHAHVHEALSQVEALRTGFSSPDLRASFMATQKRVTALAIDLEMDRHAGAPDVGHDRTALEIAERARARNLADALLSAPRPAVTGVPVELVERRKVLRRRLHALADQRFKTRPEWAEAVDRTVDTLAIELDGVEAELRRLDGPYAAASTPRALAAAEIAALLEPDTVLLEVALGPERSILWVVNSRGLRSFALPAEKHIEALVRTLHLRLSTLEAGVHRRSQEAETLSRWLLGPVWSEIAKARRLVVVPDGALHLLPFAALPAPDTGRPLLERLEISYLPSATTLALARERLQLRPAARRWAAVFADPLLTFGTAPAKPGFEPLPSTRREAEAVTALAPAGLAWTAMGAEASREEALSAPLDDFRVLHFATHAVADDRNPELSGLVLSLFDSAGRSREGLLSLPEIYELRLAADLVVLSGCRTALGKEVRGEGVMGLTRGFLYAGSPRVVASLWRVEDRATAALMSRFYRAYWLEGQPAGAALAIAQRSLARDPRYRSPFFWAAFVLQGDWR